MVRASRAPAGLTKRETEMFADLTFTFVGDFGPKLPEATLTKYVELRGGRVSAAFDGDVTHLVCTKFEFNKRLSKRNKKINLAMKKRRCNIVNIDWLELSMTQKKRLDEDPYSFRRAHAKKQAQLKAEAKKEKGFAQAEAGFVNTNFYRPYSDGTHFSYEVNLTRGDDGQRHSLCLFESIAAPHLYIFADKFQSKKGAAPLYYRMDDVPGLFAEQFAKFQKFFKVKTGINWDERLIKAGTMGETYFQYSPPTRGKPVGFVPDEFKPPEESEADEAKVIHTEGTHDQNKVDTVSTD